MKPRTHFAVGAFAEKDWTVSESFINFIMSYKAGILAAITDLQNKDSYEISADFKKKVVAAEKALKKKVETPKKKTATKKNTTAGVIITKLSATAKNDETAKSEKVSVQDSFDWFINTHNSRH
jgi:hypothetical protein